MVHVPGFLFRSQPAPKAPGFTPISTPHFACTAQMDSTLVQNMGELDMSCAVRELSFRRRAAVPKPVVN